MVDFQRVLEVLDAQGVAYVVVGGAAMAFQGSSYLTRDVDIVYDREGDNLRRLVAALGPYHPRLRVGESAEALPFVFDEATIRNGMNFTLSTELGAIDLFGEIAGIGKFADVSANADELDLHGSGVRTRVLSVDGLIRAKRAANRPKDIAVLPELEALRELQSLEDNRRPD